jgi:hypothetical protein
MDRPQNLVKRNPFAIFGWGTLSDTQAPSFPNFLAFTLAHRALCAAAIFFCAFLGIRK